MNSLIVGVLAFCAVSSAQEWHYSGRYGPPNWYQGYPKCGLHHQSPIAIDGSSAQFQDYPAFSMHGYGNPPAGAVMYIENNGHSAETVVRGEAMEISGGGFVDTYRLDEFHFHWGADSSRGSEHTVNERAYPLEMHMVHFSTNYATIEEADDGDDHSIAVLSIMFEIQEQDNPNFAEMISHISDVSHYGSSKDLVPFAVRPLMPANLDRFYRYVGSFTTPPCYESVVWTVFDETVGISERQLNVFRTMYFNHDGEVNVQLVDNFRPTQALHDRTVYKSF